MTVHPITAGSASVADVVPVRTGAGTDPSSAARERLTQALIGAYHGRTYQLLRDLAERLGASLAYVDRPTIEAHLERALSDGEWAAVNDQFSAMDLDDYVGEQGGLRTDWIEDVLDKAGVPGRGYSADGEVSP